jgi:hypothetical protein
MFTLATNVEAEIKEVIGDFLTIVVPLPPAPVTTFIAFVESIEPSAGASVTTLEVAPPKSANS